MICVVEEYLLVVLAVLDLFYIRLMISVFAYLVFLLNLNQEQRSLIYAHFNACCELLLLLLNPFLIDLLYFFLFPNPTNLHLPIYFSTNMDWSMDWIVKRKQSTLILLLLLFCNITAFRDIS